MMTQRNCRLLLLVGLAIGLCTCHQSDVVRPVAGQPLVGSWLYIENGYSPGAGYFINKVPVNPPQVVNFTAQNTVWAVNMDPGSLFSRAVTYQTELTQYGLYLHLFDGAQKEISPSLAVNIQNDTLRLSPPCYEGCHYGFVRLQ